VALREMTAGDVAGGHALSRAAGWNQRADDWRLLLESNPGRFVAALSDDGRIVGTAGAAGYGRTLAWVCMVLVDPRWRGRGLGTHLMEAVLARLGDVEVVGLDATPLGRPVYARLGFAEAATYVRMAADAPQAQGGARARAIGAGAMERVLARDRAVFGADRAQVLRWAASQAPALADDDASPSAYAFGRAGEHSRQIGPIVANDVATGRDLLIAALQGVSGRVIVDAAADVPGWIRALEAMGFHEERPLYRMYRHGARPPGDPQRQLALFGPEFG
jgi:GNAT superfamily N-acetyltransferase